MVLRLALLTRMLRPKALLLIALLAMPAFSPTGAAAQGQQPPQAPISPSTWVELDYALQTASKTQRPIFVYLHAPWCAPCHRLERDVFPRLDAALTGLITASVDLSDRSEPGFPAPSIEWARRKGLDTPPAFALLRPDGQLIASAVGYRSAPQLRLFLSLAGNHE